MRRSQRGYQIAGAALILAATTLSPAALAAAPSSVDITASAQGRSLASAAEARFAKYGVTDALRVFQMSDGTQIVAPEGYPVSDFQLRSDGSARTTTRAADTSMADAAVSAAAASWSQQSSHCFARTTIKTPHGNNGGFMDTCYRIYKLLSDGNSTYDYWNITAFATVDATRAYTTGDYAWIHVDRDGGTTFYWEDWSPRSDLNSNCGSTSLGISALGFGLSYGTTVCETWLLTKYAAAGELKVQWNGDSTGAREVALMSAIHVPQGGSPVWGISWNSVLKCYGQVAC